jgi:aminopeptidase N
VGDDLYPAIGNGGYDALAYRLRLGYRPAARMLDGRARMAALATQDLRSFSLDLQGLVVRGVRVGGVPAFFRRRATKLIVTPLAGIAAGSRFALAVTYRGVVRPVREPSSGRTGLIATRSGATVASQPIGAQNWMPSNNTPADKALFDVSMRVPSGLEMLGNGRLSARRRTGRWTDFRWVEDRPMATYLVTATLGRYEVIRSRTAAGLPLYSGLDHGPGPGGQRPSRHRLAHRRALLRRIGSVIARLQRLLGPYPFASAGGIVANAPDLDDALETQSRPVYVGEFDAETQIHELAHQWFGDMVTITRHRDMWLHEGFATWATWWARHEANPDAPTTAEAAARVYRRSERHSGHLRDVWRPAIVRRPQDLFGDAVYERGATLLEALRQRVGDRIFRRILRDWLAEHAYANATTRDFIALSERDAGQPLDDLFDDWLYTRGKPTVSPPRAHARGLR